MKFLVLVVALAMFVSAQALTDAQKEKLKEHYGVCTEETGADKELIKKVRGGDFTVEDDKVKEFMFCMFKRIGVMDNDANFLKDVALSKVDESIRDKVSKAIDACLGKTGDTNAQTAWNYAKCYHVERPDHDFV